MERNLNFKGLCNKRVKASVESHMYVEKVWGLLENTLVFCQPFCIKRPLLSQVDLYTRLYLDIPVSYGVRNLIDFSKPGAFYLGPVKAQSTQEVLFILVGLNNIALGSSWEQVKS